MSSTPEFFGANPGTIDAGAGRQIRVLGPEEDIARQILKLCTPEQQKVCLDQQDRADEVPARGPPQPEIGPPVGLPVSPRCRRSETLAKRSLERIPQEHAGERRTGTPRKPSNPPGWTASISPGGATAN